MALEGRKSKFSAPTGSVPDESLFLMDSTFYMFTHRGRPKDQALSSLSYNSSDPIH